MFNPGSFFQVSLIFAGKARSLLLEKGTVRALLACGTNALAYFAAAFTRKKAEYLSNDNFSTNSLVIKLNEGSGITSFRHVRIIQQDLADTKSTDIYRTYCRYLWIGG